MNLPDESVIRIRVWKAGFKYYQGPDFTRFQPSNILSVGFFKTAHRASQCCRGNYRMDVGHVSLETPDLYISLWPNGPPDPTGKIVKVRPATINTLEEDLELEGRDPEETIILETLNVRKITRRFLDLMEDDPEFYLAGRDRVCGFWNGDNCCGFVYDLLVAGEIEELVPSKCNNLNRMIMTPDQLLSLVTEAKRRERRTV